MSRRFAMILAGLAACSGNAAGTSSGGGHLPGSDGGGTTSDDAASSEGDASSGGGASSSGGAGGREGGSGDAGAQDGGGDGAIGGSARCPAALPTFGANCPALGLSCTYGDSTRPSCRTIMGCGGAQQCNCGSDICPPNTCTIPQVWVGGGPDSGVGLTDRCSWSCPATPPSAGQTCTPPGYCAEPDGTQCGCIGLNTSGASVWRCLPPPTDPRCPRVAPLVGSACTDEGLACGNYDICVTGSRVLCKGGVWVDDFGSCPN